jgi:hypothetical protein
VPQLVADGHLINVPIEDVYSGVVSLLRRFIADGPLIDVPIESVYFRVLSLREFRIIIFPAKTDGLEPRSTDIGNGCLEPKTQEKVYNIPGPEFKELERRRLVVFKAIGSQRNSRKRCSERPTDCLKESRYIHLQCDIYRDDDRFQCMQPRKFIEKMIEMCVQFFGTRPGRKYQSPLEKEDHPEIDTSYLLDDDGTKPNQSLIGPMQWTVSLARIEIATTVMTLSGFRVAPRVGHLERVKRVYGCILPLKDAAIRVRSNEPDYSYLPEQNFEWMHSVYGDNRELIPHDVPEAFRKTVRITHYLDAIGWFCKMHPTVETATYGSEVIASCTCVERDVDLRTPLRYLGVLNALSFHRVREAINHRAIGFYHLRSEENQADSLSKHWRRTSAWHQDHGLNMGRGLALRTVEFMGSRNFSSMPMKNVKSRFKSYSTMTVTDECHN